MAYENLKSKYNPTYKIGESSTQIPRLSKRVLDTAVETLARVGYGIVDTAEGVWDFGQWVSMMVQDLPEEEQIKRIKNISRDDIYTALSWGKESTKEDFLKVTKDSWYQNNKTGQLVGGVTEAIGQQLPMILLTQGLGMLGKTPEAVATLTKIAQGVNIGYLGASAAGRSMNEASSEGATPKQAFTYGLGSGALESGIEMIGGDSITGIFPNIIKTKAGVGVGARLVRDAIGEGLEEVISDVANPLLKTIYDKDALKEYGTKDLWKGAGESFAIGGLSSLALGGMSYSGRALNIEIEEHDRLVEDYSKAKTKLEKEKIYAKIKNNANKISERLNKLDSTERENYLKYINKNGEIIGQDGKVVDKSISMSHSLNADMDKIDVEIQNINKSLDEKNPSVKHDVKLADNFNKTQAQNLVKLTRFVNQANEKTNSNMQFAILEDMDVANGGIVDGVIYINKDNLNDDTWMKTITHEGIHFVENTNPKVEADNKLFKKGDSYVLKPNVEITQEKTDIRKHLDTELEGAYIDNKDFTLNDSGKELIDDLANRGYITKEKATELKNSNLPTLTNELITNKKFENEFFAVAGERILGNKGFINSVIRGDIGLANKILNKIDEREAKANLSETERKAYKKVKKAFTEALEEKGYRYYKGKIIGKGDKDKLEDGDTLEYSLKIGSENIDGTLEVKKDLVVLHNLGANQLLSVIELGGFPMPSIAVTKANIPHENYGDISVVFDKNTIDPQRSAYNKVYSRDAWTPTFPRVDALLDKDLINKRQQQILGDEKIPDFYKQEIEKFFDQFRGYNGDYTFNKNDLGSSFNDYIGSKYLYLKDMDYKGNLDYEYKTNKPDAVLEKAIKDFNITRLSLGGYYNMPYNELLKEYGDFVKAYYVNDIIESSQKAIESGKATLEQVTKAANNLFEDLSLSNILRVLDSAKNYLDIQANPKNEIDIYKTKDKLDNIIKTEYSMEDYNKWSNSLVNGVIKKVGIRNNEDTFYYDGRRKRFNQLHYEYTLGNIVKIMRQENEHHQSWLGVNPSSLAGVLTKEFKSIKSIKDASALLGNDENIDEKVSTVSSMLIDVCNLMERKGNENNPFIALDNMASIVYELAEELGGNTTKEDIVVYIKQRNYACNMNENIAEKILLLFQTLQAMPTTYFEAKPRRAVSLDEIRQVLLPENTNQDLVSKLKENNIPFTYYNETNTRSDILQSKEFESVRFSFKGEQEYHETETELDKLRNEFREENNKLQEIELPDFYTKAVSDYKKGNIKYSEFIKYAERFNEWAKGTEYEKIDNKVKELNKKINELERKQATLEYNLNKQLYEKEWTEEEISNAIKQNVKHYHTTNYIGEAGYLLRTGNMLDFSGRSDGAYVRGHDTRSIDHREISLDLPYWHDYSASMYSFMNMGNIRLQSYGMELSKLPNQKQFNALYNIVPQVFEDEDSFIVDYVDKYGNNKGSSEYQKGTAVSRIINDIKEYFETGKVNEGNVQFSLKRDVETELKRTLGELNTYSDEDLIDAASDIIGFDVPIDEAFELVGEDSPLFEEKKGKLSKKEIESIANDLWFEIGTRSQEKRLKIANQIADRILSKAKLVSNKVDTETQNSLNAYKHYFHRIHKEDIDWKMLSENYPAQSFNKWLSEDGIGWDDVVSALNERGQFDGELDSYLTPKLKETGQIEEFLLELEKGYRQAQEFAKRENGAFINNITTEQKERIKKRLVISLMNIFNDPNIVAKTDTIKNEFIAEINKEREFLKLKEASLNEEYQKKLQDVIDRYEKLLSAEATRNESMYEKLKADFDKEVARLKEIIKDQDIHLANASYSLDKLSQQIASLHKSLAFNENRVAQFELNREITKISELRDNSMWNEVFENELILNLVKKIGRLRNNLGTISGNAREVVKDLVSNKEVARYLFNISESELEENNPFLTILEDIASGEGKLTTEELINLKEAFASLRYNLQNLNKVWFENRRQDEYDIARQGLQDADTTLLVYSADYTARNKVTQILNTSVNFIASPEYVFEKMSNFDGKYLPMRMFNELVEGNNKKKRFKKQTSYIQDWIKEHKNEIKDWREANIDIDGHKLSMTQIISLVALSRREQAINHIFGNGGDYVGRIKITDMKARDKSVKDSVDKATTIEIGYDFISKAEEKLTPLAKEYMELQYKFFNEDSRQAFVETQDALYGTHLSPDANYFPIRTDKDQFYQTFGNPNVNDLYTIFAPSFAKKTIQHAKNLIVVEDCFDVVIRHQNQMATYYGLAVPIRSINRILNRAVDNESLKVKYRSIDKDFVPYLNQLMSDLQNPRQTNTEFERIFNVLRGWTIKATLSWNVKVWASQITSLPNAHSLGLKYKNIALGLTNAIKHIKDTTKEMMDKSIVAWDRYNSSGFNQDLVDAFSKDGATPKSIIEKFVDAGMSPIQAIDMFTVSAIWEATKIEYGIDENSTQEEWDKMISKFEKVVNRTQPSYDTLYRSELLRNPSFLTKMISMYKTQPLQQLSQLLEGVSQYYTFRKLAKQDSKYETDFKRAKRELVQKISGVTMSVISYSIIGTLFAELINAGRKDDDENVFAELGNQILNASVGMIPVVTDIVSAFSGYENQDLYYSSIGNFVSAVTNLTTTVANLGNPTEQSKRKVASGIRSVLLTASSVFGVPTKNVEKYLRGVSGIFSPTARLSYDNLYYTKSQKKLVEMAKKGIDSGDEYYAEMCIEIMLQDAIGDVSKSVSKEIVRLLDNDISISIKSAPSGLTKKQLRIFNNEYKKALRKVEALIKSREYRKLDDSEKAKAINRIFNEYYNSAKEKID